MCGEGSYVDLQCLLHISGLHVSQGEERDSSDDEWDRAHAALDPIAQIGWGNRSIDAHGAAARAVRDVFQAAEDAHDEAMSDLDGMAENDAGSGGEGRDAALQSEAHEGGAGMDAGHIVEGEIDGGFFGGR